MAKITLPDFIKTASGSISKKRVSGMVNVHSKTRPSRDHLPITKQ